MATNIYLGPSGSETLLPPVNWMAGSPPDLPVPYKKQIDKSTMLDGSTRYNFKSYHPKSYTLEWAMLTAANVLTLIGLAELNTKLHYQNNWIDATWRWVAVTAFEYSPMQETFAAAAVYYRASMSLEEVL